jgi:hypothetical protein
MIRNPYKKRIQIAVTILSDILRRGDEISREKAVEILQKQYRKYGITPLKGKATPTDIYDKELASLYIVGKYGLGLHEEYPGLFKKIFYLEETYEEIIDKILSGEYESARNMLKGTSASGVIDGNSVARLLRIPFTKLVMGFISEEEFSKILHKAMEAFPEEQRTVENYVRFYVGYKVAEAIYRGEARNRAYKEALKRSIALRLGFPTSTPSDEYIAAIAREVFGVPDRILGKVLKLEKEKEEAKESPSASEN